MEYDQVQLAQWIYNKPILISSLLLPSEIWEGLKNTHFLHAQVSNKGGQRQTRSKKVGIFYSTEKQRVNSKKHLFLHKLSAKSWKGFKFYDMSSKRRCFLYRFFYLSLVAVVSGGADVVVGVGEQLRALQGLLQLLHLSLPTNNVFIWGYINGTQFI